MRHLSLAAVAVVTSLLLGTGGTAVAASPSPSPLRLATTDLAAGYAATAVALADPATPKADGSVLVVDVTAVRRAYRQAVAAALLQGNVNNLDDEQVLTAFYTLVDAIGALETSWVQHRQQFSGQQRYLLAESALLARPCRLDRKAPCSVLHH